jgi:ATP-dependent metalloprotease
LGETEGRFLESGMTRARKLLSDHKDDLHKLASALVEYETLTLEEVKRILAGESLSRVNTEGIKLQGEVERAGLTGAVVDGI